MTEDSNSSGGFKSSLEDGNSGGDGEKGSKRGEGPQVELRILLQSKNAFGIIGKGGSNIKRLRSEYTSSVMLPDNFFNERILSISGDMGNVCACMLEIIPQLEDVQMLVHRSLVGGIIGHSGLKIKELREKTQTDIKVFADTLPSSTDRVVCIKGNADKVVKCIESIFETIKDLPIKGRYEPYNPSDVFADTTAAADGYFTSRGGMRGGRGGRGRGGRGGRGGSRGGGNSWDFDVGMGSEFDDKMRDHRDQQNTRTQVTIPNEYFERISGQRIHTISSRSGAEITIGEPQKGDRIITITGTDEQISYAQFLIQQAGREAGGAY